MYYGVLRGKVEVFKREDTEKTPHLQIKVVDANNEAWRIAVNVQSGDKSFLIYHRADPLPSYPLPAGLQNIKPGFTLIEKPARSASTSMDYLRAPLFDWPTGIAVPPSGPQKNDDLQDALCAYLKNLIESDGEIFAFGAMFPEPGKGLEQHDIDTEFGTKKGIHNIHMNQGNPRPGKYADDNGVFHDGGVILKFPDRLVGLFLRFKTQWLPTDGEGERIPGISQEVLPGSTPAPAPEPGSGPVHPTVSYPEVYIGRALVNPAQADPGKEIVVLGNTTTSQQDLTDWKIVDKNNKEEPISSLQLPPGESCLVLLSGNNAQLGNKGGTIRLIDKKGVQVHAVSYTAEEASREGRYVRFIT